MNIHSEDNNLLPLSLLASGNFPAEADHDRSLAASKTDDNRPVTQRELIDAIAKLHVIDDGSESFSTILNKLRRQRRNYRTEVG